MTERAREFLDRWEADHVEVVPGAQREREAILLAAACREDARRAGIAASDLERAADGDLVRSLMEALEAAARGANDEVAN